MDKRAFWIVVGAGAIIAVLLAVFVAPWASSQPDGLERIAEDKGFLEIAEETEPTWSHSPIPDYEFPRVENSRVATGIAGLAGVMITLVVTVLLALMLKKRKAKNETRLPG